MKSIEELIEKYDYIVEHNKQHPSGIDPYCMGVISAIVDSGHKNADKVTEIREVLQLLDYLTQNALPTKEETQ